MTLDGEWKAVEGATAAERAGMWFFKVVVRDRRGAAVTRERAPHALWRKVFSATMMPKAVVNDMPLAFL